MAVTRNTYTGNGSTTNYSFTFPYLETTDIKVSVNGTNTTAYTLANATTIQFNTAPANGASIAIYRQTDDTALSAAFYPGSAIRSADLNDNFTQNLYVTQESNRDATDAIGYGQQAISTANGAVSTANAATATANTASSNASAAVATANTASSNASAAVSTANTASSNATSAVNTANAATATANSAAADAATAISTANSAVSTANSAVSTANSAVTTAGNAVTSANSAVSSATAAVSTANTASTNASNAVTTANTASSNASTALSTANSALSTANAAASAVANAILYDTVANVAAIPASPTNNDAVEVVDSTGIESFTPLSGKPAGFVGDSGLSVRIVYTTTGSTWNWIQYFPNDPENRYGDAITTLQTDLNTAEADILALDSAKLDSTTAASTYQTQAGMSSYLTTSAAGSTYAPLASPTFTGTPTGPSFSVTGSTVPSNGLYLPAANSVAISTNGTKRIEIQADGDIDIDNGGVFYDATNNRLAIGTTSPGTALDVNGVITSRSDSFAAIRFRSSTGTDKAFLSYEDGSTSVFLNNYGSGPIVFKTVDAERVRIDSSGRLLVGTSSGSLSYSSVVVRGNPAASGVQGTLELSRASLPSTNGAGIGTIAFTDSSSNLGATIAAIAEGSWTSGSNHRSRLEFSTTSDNSASPSERLRIASTGALGLSGANYGSSGQVLTSQGSGSAPQWATPSSGALQYISSVTANNSSSVSFTSGIDSTYDVYKIVGVNLTHSNGLSSGGFFGLRTSSNGGSSYDAGAIDYMHISHLTTALVHNKYAIQSSSVNLSYGIGMYNFSPTQIELEIYRPGYADKVSGYFRLNTYGNYDIADYGNNYGYWLRNNAAVVNAVQFFFSGTNIATGTFRLYGLKNS